jgi:hypothetical protein
LHFQQLSDVFTLFSPAKTRNNQPEINAIACKSPVFQDLNQMQSSAENADRNSQVIENTAPPLSDQQQKGLIALKTVDLYSVFQSFQR